MSYLAREKYGLELVPSHLPMGSLDQVYCFATLHIIKAFALGFAIMLVAVLIFNFNFKIFRAWMSYRSCAIFMYLSADTIII